MINNIDKKHLLVVGKSEKERGNFIDHIVTTSNKVVYRFPKNIRSFEEYIEQVRRLFPFVPTNWHEQNPKKWTINQVWDFHLDWTSNTQSILIVIEELGLMEKNWKTEILRDYLARSYDQEQLNTSLISFQLIVTQQEEEELLDRVGAIICLKENEKRTGKLQLINLDYL